ncbi:RNA polymerase sigma factor [Dyadobacter psychrophilus]|uniref:RNA polymerase sigma factor, sigma-70 family n=1 Tax=Dyadobacter psychrophilus TaxID=651661 RepID=A0A1T5EUF8_9BACT|nr:RNA polymerase sigma factor [Dyadobacter psychrophilus]SKB87573.1 RNA polymerase sigma factor, sigma-70 family [Dyadobacter psychrophilus]
MDNRSNNFWESIYRQNIAKMIGVCWRYTQDRQTAEDLAHDAFVVAINKASSFENKGPFEAWLRRIVVNVALQYLRERKKSDNLDRPAATTFIYSDVEDENSHNDLHTFSEAELLEVIGYLPEHHRLVFNLYVIDNFSHAQIAARLSISEGTSKSHLARARKKIRQLLQAKLQEDKKRRRTFLLLLFPSRFWHIDSLITKGLNGFEIEPLKNRPENIALDLPPVSNSRPFMSNKTYLKYGISSVASVMVLIAILKYDVISEKKNLVPVITSRTLDSTAKKLSQLNDSTTATILQNPVIVEKIKKSEPMKTMNTLGGLLMAGLAFDTSALPTTLPVTFKNPRITANNAPAMPKIPESIQPLTAQKLPKLAGTFHASELFWSDADRALYLKGNDVKVHLTNQKFKGSGTFSFIKGINYMVINGNPMKLNETIALTEQEYYIKVLNEAEGAKKYGDEGKYGVVEIMLADKRSGK